jgi:transposase-like protein
MPAGRPTSFKPEYVEQVRKLCLLGATNPELAGFFGVSIETLDNWRKAHPEFLDALKEGKMQADANVGQRLYERAMGFQHPEEKIFQADGQIIRADTIKQYPPDTTAAIFWLKNRRPDAWREKADLNLGGQPENPVKVITYGWRKK